MRTTISIDDGLLRSAKGQARSRGLTLSQFVEEALRGELSARRTETRRPEVPVFRGRGGLRPGIDPMSSRGLLEALDTERSVERSGEDPRGSRT